MFGFGKKTLVVKNVKSLRSRDPLSEFKRTSEREVGRYSVRGEVWKSVRKLLLIAVVLFLFYFVRECWLSWNIFQ